MSAEAAGRFLGGTASRVIRGSYVGNCGPAVTARWFWWVASRRSRRWVGKEEENWWVLSRPENGWKDRRGVVGRPQAALPLPATTAQISSSSSSAGAQVSRGGGGSVREGGGGGGGEGETFPTTSSPLPLLIRKARVRSRSPVGTWWGQAQLVMLGRSSGRCL